MLLQVPGWALMVLVLFFLHKWFGFSVWVAGGVVALLVLKDIVIYPLFRVVWQAKAKSGTEQLIGIQGIAKDHLEPKGYVQIGGELWRAEAEPAENPMT